jgi:hypothetical protein
MKYYCPKCGLDATPEKEDDGGLLELSPVMEHKLVSEVSFIHSGASHPLFYYLASLAIALQVLFGTLEAATIMENIRKRIKLERAERTEREAKVHPL